MKHFFWFYTILLVAFSSCINPSGKNNDEEINIDSILALPPDTLEWEELEIPAGADGLFDDFFFNFVRNSRFQEERIAFPLPVHNGKVTSKIDSDEWTFDRLESLQEVNTMIFDHEADLSCSQDTSVNNVTIDFIYFNCDSVQQYVFNRIEGRWKLTQLNWLPFKQHPDGNFYAFYKAFANDSVFQRRSIRNPFEFKTYEEYSNEEITGEVDVDTWWECCPELPKEILTNINYGQCLHKSKERYLVITSLSAGMSSTLKFRRDKRQWKLVALEN